jgi:hypothetical protein
VGYIVVLECENVEDCGVYGEVEHEGGEEALEASDDREETLKPENGVENGRAGNE